MQTFSKTESVYPAIALAIIKYEEKIVGPVAWLLAGKVAGLSVIKGIRPELSITQEPKAVIDRLVTEFEYLFGLHGRLECKEAASELTAKMPTVEIPLKLQ